MKEEIRQRHEEYREGEWKISIAQFNSDRYNPNQFYIHLYRNILPEVNNDAATLIQLNREVKNRVKQHLFSGDVYNKHRIIDVKLPTEWVAHTPSCIHIEVHLLRSQDLGSDKVTAKQYLKVLCDDIKPTLTTLTQNIDSLIQAYNTTDEELNRSREIVEVLDWLFEI